MGKALVSSSGGRSYYSAVDISIEEFVKDIRSHRVTRLDAVADGYFNVKMFSDKAGYSLSTAGKMLDQGFKNGKLDRIYVKERDGKTARYYRPHKKK